MLQIKMPVMELCPDSLEQDLVWSDPKLDLKGYEPNKLRNVSVAFGEDIVHKTCKRLGLDLIIRAHQVFYFKKNFQNICLAILLASTYHGK